jgi:hypothetical protein
MHLKSIYEGKGYFRDSENVLTVRGNELERYDVDSSSVTIVGRNGAADVEAGLRSHGSRFRKSFWR